jgi:hypothetical protein
MDGVGVRAPGAGNGFGVGEKFDIVCLSNDQGRLSHKLLLAYRCGITFCRVEAIALEGSVGWRLNTGESDWR